MRYMLCYAVKAHSARAETEYYEKFEDAVMKYTVLCSNCDDVVLADTETHMIIRHFCHRSDPHGCAVTNY